MDKLKLYAAPIIALVLLLVWFFVVRPMLAEDAPSEDAASQKSE
jgi:hypothetical protein